MVLITALALCLSVGRCIAQETVPVASEPEDDDEEKDPVTDVILYVRWEAPSSMATLRRLVPQDPQLIARAYAKYMLENLAIVVRFNDSTHDEFDSFFANRRGGSRSWRTQPRSYKHFSHPLRTESVERVILSGKMLDLFGQLDLTTEEGENTGASFSRRHLASVNNVDADTITARAREARQGAAKRAKKDGFIAELQRATDKFAELVMQSIKPTFDSNEWEGEYDGDNDVVTESDKVDYQIEEAQRNEEEIRRSAKFGPRGRKLLAYRGRVSPKTPVPAGTSTRQTTPTTEVTPKLTITLARDVPIHRDAAVVTDKWHIDRIDQPSLPLNNLYTTPSDLPNTNTSDQSWIYIVDSGVRTSHMELYPRASLIYNEYPQLTPGCDPHGTHVASLAAGKTVGVNSGALVFDVRVLDCDGDGTLGGLIRGISEVTDHCVAAGGGLKRSIVINMSLGAPAGAYSPEGRALAGELGMARQYCDAIIVAAAGNDHTDACYYIPASLTGTLDGGVITAGATTVTDAFASYSNYGPCVTVNAPGTNIVGASSASDSAIITMSGTSMASPIVAGVASLHTARRPRWYNTYPIELYANVVYQLMVVDQSVKSKVIGTPTITTTRSLIQIPPELALSSPSSGGGEDGIITIIPSPGVSDRETPPPDPGDSSSVMYDFIMVVTAILVVAGW